MNSAPQKDEWKEVVEAEFMCSLFLAPGPAILLIGFLFGLGRYARKRGVLLKVLAIGSSCNSFNLEVALEGQDLEVKGTQLWAEGQDQLIVGVFMRSLVQPPAIT